MTRSQKEAKLVAELSGGNSAMETALYTVLSYLTIRQIDIMFSDIIQSPESK